MTKYSNEKITGLRIEFYQSDSECNSREWDNATKMVCFHSKYDLGDKTDYKSEDFNSWKELEAAILKTEKVLLIKPLFMLDRSGLVISTSSFANKWDSDQIGFIYVTQENVDITGIKTDIESLERGIKEELETYNQDISGEVYGYTCYKDGEVVDACGGFYGNDIKTNGMLEHIPEEFNELVKEIDFIEINY